FIPFGVLGSDAGASGNRLDIAVPANSKIQKLEELAGHQLTCTRPDSITGYRAAVAVLMNEASMRPYVDYSINWSFGQSESIRGLVDGSIPVAALSEEKVQSLIKKDRLKQSDLRVVFQSQVIPHLTIGYVHNLQPALAEKLSAAVFSFENNQGTADDL